MSSNKVSDTGLDSATIRALAVEADVDPRTVARALRGLPIRGMAAKRVHDVLKQHGLVPVVRAMGLPRED